MTIYLKIFLGLIRGNLEVQEDINKHGLFRKIYEMAGSDNNVK